MGIEWRREGDVWIAALSGEPPTVILADKLEAWIDAGHTRILLNLKDLRGADATLVEYLVALRGRLAKKGGGLAVAEPPDAVRSLFAALGPALHPRESEALASLARPAPDDGTGEVTVLRLDGTIEAFQLPSLAERMGRLIEGGCLRLILNAKGLEFINSSGLGYLIQAARGLKEQGGELVIADPSPFLGTMIETLGVEEILPVFESEGQALAHFA